MKYRVLKIIALITLLVTVPSCSQKEYKSVFDTNSTIAYYEYNNVENGVTLTANNTNDTYKDNLDYEHLCSTNSGVTKAFRLIGYIILISKIIAPLMIIVVGSVDFFKAMTSSDKNATGAATKTFIMRIISGILVFFAPTIIMAILHLLEVTNKIEEDSSFAACTTCLFDVTNCAVIEKDTSLNRGNTAKSENSTPKIGIAISGNKVILFDMSKVDSKYNYTGALPSRDSVKLPPGARPITDSVDIEEVNRLLAEAAVGSGLYSRNAVINVATTLIYTLEDDYEYYIPYELGGMYHRGDTWGINPEWGSLTTHNGKVELSGLDCRNFVNWTFKQAGLALNRGFGGEGSMESYGDNAYKNIADGRPGDVLDCPGHIMLIVDKTENGFVIAESNGVGRVRTQEYTFSELKNAGYSAYNMDAVYNDEGMYSQGKSYSAYADSFHIPSDMLPESYTELIDGSAKSTKHIVYGEITDDEDDVSVKEKKTEKTGQSVKDLMATLTNETISIAGQAKKDQESSTSSGVKQPTDTTTSKTTEADEGFDTKNDED